MSRKKTLGKIFVVLTSIFSSVVPQPAQGHLWMIAAVAGKSIRELEKKLEPDVCRQDLERLAREEQFEHSSEFEEAFQLFKASPPFVRERIKSYGNERLRKALPFFQTLERVNKKF